MPVFLDNVAKMENAPALKVKSFAETDVSTFSRIVYIVVVVTTHVPRTKYVHKESVSAHVQVAPNSYVMVPASISTKT